MKSGVLRSKNATILQARCAIVLLERVKVQLSPQTRKCHRFACFCNCNCKTSTICHEWTRFFTIGAG